MARRRAGGFAYLWTLALVALMGAGLAIGADLYATAARRDQERELIFIGHEFRRAIGRYFEINGANGQHQYPQTLEELLKDPRFPNPKRHLRRLYTDPTTGQAEWGLVMQQGRIVGVRSLSGRTPIKQDNFDDDDDGLRHKKRYADWLFTYPPELFTAQPGGAP
ncbi:type II secretion system protein [Janthinobacterium fluminis]|uniref:Type II secretion system protein n=1 Tax=Janthinobacterium fluminis TaxID=2987524 RepID=A0ABT5K2L4_9BURK|nr:type II secretion system protein [Janthinobacterium fluminis]MDC8758638.1 type II secretion system protein [Janthinobacterium fluminis]